ncbi:hypothetical protein HanIR_Chr08g0382961 [Helianthus annuus]|nr:hypothetical protein HanIR_Chr08g0382961 [Helianthus annuus]
MVIKTSNIQWQIIIQAQVNLHVIYIYCHTDLYLHGNHEGHRHCGPQIPTRLNTSNKALLKHIYTNTIF